MRQILGIQALRGLAAASIAVLHISQAAGAFHGHQGVAPFAWMRRVPWEAGVDVFFVISGFVIVYASAGLFGRSGSAMEFLSRRIARIVPLYWLVTTLFVLLAVAGPVALHDPLGGGPRYVLASYLFLPWPRPDGVMEPVYRLGWTLNYEMLFYGIVALFLAARLRLALPLIGASAAALALAGALWRPAQPQLAYWTDPIVLEFAYGVGLAGAVLAGARLPAPARLALVVAGLLGLALDGTTHGVGRAVSFGLPACCLVAAVALGAPRPEPRLARAFVLLGDMSYALYLTHLFPLRVLREIWARLGFVGPIGVAAYILASLVAAVLLAVLVNRWFEQPATRTVRLALRAA